MISRSSILATALIVSTSAMAQDVASLPGPTPAETAAEKNIPVLSKETLQALLARIQSGKGAMEQVTNPALAVPRNSTVDVTFQPGGVTPIIKIAKGYITSVSFLDTTGQPWPLVWDLNSNPSRSLEKVANNPHVEEAVAPAVLAGNGFDVNTPVKGGNTINIQSVSDNQRSSLSVMLLGAPVPVTFMLVEGPNEFDARVSVHVRARGPNAKAEVINTTNIPATGSAELTGMLDGYAPANFTPLSVTGVSPDDVRAWRFGPNSYVRTNYTLLSPQPVAWEKGEGGMTIYQIQAAPVILVSKNGEMASVRLQER